MKGVLERQSEGQIEGARGRGGERAGLRRKKSAGCSIEGTETGRENAGDRLKLKIKADVGGRSADARRERCREEWRKRRSLSRGRAAY